jgi:hypothetical protein
LNKRNILLAALILIIVFALSGCAPGDGAATPSHPAGFFWGVWHGWIAPISLIIGLFNHSIRVYEVNNVGWWYDFGFYIAVISGFGGLSLSRHQHKDKD